MTVRSIVRIGSRSRHLLLAALAGGLLVAATPAPSEARYACAVNRTADGFVALRAGPSTSQSVVARMRPQEMVGLLHPPEYESIVRSGAWLYVRYYPGTRRTADNIPAVQEDQARVGWVRDRLIDCFE